MNKWDKVVDTIVKTIDARIKKPSSAYSTEAQVKRIEGQTAYVDIPGGEPNMPARLTIDAKVGDTVQVSVDDHKATLTGNRSAPPTDDTTANEAKDTAEKNKRKVIKLEEQTGLIRQGVEGAQNMARQAEEDAENALTAANGKNKVYYQATQPTGGTYQVGDTWFDTANDNKIYHWAGTAWAASLLGDDALDTFSANHINAGSIDASNVTISNLNAGNITSGYLNAARIETGSLSIGKTSGLQTALDNAGAANQYVTTISGVSGITVHNANDTSNFVNTNSNGVYIYKGGKVQTGIIAGEMDLYSYYGGVDTVPLKITYTTDPNRYGRIISEHGNSRAMIELYTYSGTNGSVTISGRKGTAATDKCELVVGPSGIDGWYHNQRVLYLAGDSSDTPVLTMTGNVSIGGNIKFNSKAPFTTFTATGSTGSISAGSGGHASCTGTVPSGYTIIGIQTVTTNHTFSGAISSMTLLSNGAYIDVVNTGSSSQSFTVTATILCTSIK